MASKGVIVSVSLILVVGVVIGAVVVSNNRNGHSSGGQNNLSTNMKTVEVICAPTSYKDKCISSIAPVAANSSAGLKDYLRAALTETTEATKVGLETSQKIKIENLTRYDELALSECRKFLQFAVEELQEASALLEANDLQGIHDEVYEFRVWLTAVGVHQDTCLDQIENLDLKVGMQNGLSNATLLTVNAVDIFADLSNILVALNIQVNASNPNHRKLLDVGEHGYPRWLSDSDRRLLEDPSPVPDAIVDPLGSGPKVFNTITAAINAKPKKLLPTQKYVIYVKAGIYKEVNLTVPKHQKNVFMYGDGPEKTIITGNKSYGSNISAIHTPTSATYSFAVQGRKFLARSMKFENLAGPEGEQAVALLVMGDMAAFFDCKLEGFQDTLYAYSYRQFYRDCVISGTIDFVFGAGNTLIQNSQIIVRRPRDEQTNMVSASGKQIQDATSALVFQNCSIVAQPELLAPNRPPIKTFLGRPWKQFASAVFMESFIGGFIDPQGWSIWNQSNPNNQNCFFAEYANTGPGAITNGRVNWPTYKLINDSKDALPFTAAQILKGPDSWLADTGIPYYTGFANP